MPPREYGYASTYVHGTSIRIQDRDDLIERLSVTLPETHTFLLPGRSYPNVPIFCFEATLRGWGLSAGMVSVLADLARRLDPTLEAVSYAVKRREKRAKEMGWRLAK